MTPAIKALQQAGIAYELAEYDVSHISGDYGQAASHQLGLDAAIIFKTLVAQADKQHIVAIVPTNARLDWKKLAAAADAKKAGMGNPERVQKLTGYVLGGVSPLGQKKALPTLIDASARHLDCMHVSGGKRGLSVGLAPADLAWLTTACFADITG